jgi:hypothetical protein
LAVKPGVKLGLGDRCRHRLQRLHRFRLHSRRALVEVQASGKNNKSSENSEGGEKLPSLSSPSFLF